MIFGLKKGEIALWAGSVSAMFFSFLLFRGQSPLNLAASLIGITALIFCAKGNPIGQLLIIIFSLFYGFISLSCAYYGEMITYLCMSAPMAVLALISWLRHPYKGKRSEVRVGHLLHGEVWLMLGLTAAVTLLFYVVLAALHTANVAVSTLSVTTSFLAVYLTYRRSPYYALAYAANDLVLILLWTLATLKNTAYLSVVICFLAFLVNDVYGFFSWKRMQAQQKD